MDNLLLVRQGLLYSDESERLRSPFALLGPSAPVRYPPSVMSLGFRDPFSDRLPRSILEQPPWRHRVLWDGHIERGRDSAVIGSVLGAIGVALNQVGC